MVKFGIVSGKNLIVSGCIFNCKWLEVVSGKFFDCKRQKFNCKLLKIIYNWHKSQNLSH